VPYARANALFAELLRDEPLTVPIELPALAQLALPSHALVAIARTVHIWPAKASDRVAFVTHIDLEDAGHHVMTLATTSEVKPVVAQKDGATEISIGFGPENVVSLKPVLDGDQRRALADTLARWLPQLPRLAIEQLEDAFAADLLEATYAVVHRTLLRRLGEVTRLSVRVPEVPVANVVVTSRHDDVSIAIQLALPVRRAIRVDAQPADNVALRLSASAAAELANWAIDRGHLPQHYTRDLKPAADGQFRPYFDYRAGDRARPVKIHIFQERGGCSHFVVGLRAAVRVNADKLELATRDQYVEQAQAGVLLELGLAIKQLIEGSLDRSRRAFARVEVTIGGRVLAVQLLRAELAFDELYAELAISRAKT